jgi:putative Holliday junction resolvase
MRIMGLDLGSKRIGVAVSDELGWTAQGVTVIKRSSSWLSQLDELVDQYQVTKLVVGLPRNMDGSIGARGIDCQEVAEELKKRYNLPVDLWDERLSTTAVERTLIAADVSRKKRKAVIDQMAASWILQGYLDAQGGKYHG